MMGVLNAREVIAVKRASTAALAVSTSIAESGGLSSDMFVVDMNEKVDGNSSARVKLSRGSAKTGDENAFKKAVAHFVPVE